MSLTKADIKLNDWVDINSVKFNPWNPKEKRSQAYQKVKESVNLNGQIMPIVVRESTDPDFKFEVVDGEQRLTALLDLGEDKVWIVSLGKISDEDAKAKTIWLEQAVPFDDDLLGELLLELDGNIELPYTHEEIELIAGVIPETDDEPLPELPKKEFTIIKLKVHKDNLSEYMEILTKAGGEYDDEVVNNALFRLVEAQMEEPIWKELLETEKKLKEGRENGD